MLCQKTTEKRDIESKSGEFVLYACAYAYALGTKQAMKVVSKIKEELVVSVANTDQENKKEMYGLSVNHSKS